MTKVILAIGLYIIALSPSAQRPEETMANEEEQVKALHAEYFQALGSGDMDALADKFTFPAAFKGFLEDVVVATDKESLATTYQALIAAAPKASRGETNYTEVAYIRPNVYMLTYDYEQFDENDTLIHKGKAIYFAKKVDGEFRLFAVF